MLLLWDIDGTLLLGATGAHLGALHDTLADLFGVAGTSELEIVTAGRTDLEIARELLRRSGVREAEIDARRDELADAWIAAHAARCAPDLTHTVAPGIPALLERLGARGDVRQALLTGNLEPIARLKLARAGIGGFFAPGQGAFGSDDEARSSLPEVARRRAGAPRAPWPRERTVIIGDTPRDVACARADGVRALGVATGHYGVQELGEADAVARDAGELGERLETLLAQAATG